MIRHIENISQLDALRVQERAVVFLYVNWAIHARNSAKTAEEMIDHWNREHPNDNIDLSWVDLSDQSGDIWDGVSDWLTLQRIPDAGSLMFSGAGSIMWVRSGNIVQYVISGSSRTIDELLAWMNHSLGTLESKHAT